MASSPDLEHLEQELRAVYSKIAEAHGLSNAMQVHMFRSAVNKRRRLTIALANTNITAITISTSQALGRLMLAGATFAAPPATAPQPAAASPAPAPTPDTHRTPLPPPSATQNGSSPFESLTPLEPGPTTPAPIASIAASVPQPAHTTSHEPTTGSHSTSPAPGASPGQPSPIHQQQQLRELAPQQTLESIRTMPSATLSQLPSGVLSLISPSDAGEADQESEYEKDGSPDVHQDKTAGRDKASDLSVAIPVAQITAMASGVAAGASGGAGAGAGAGVEAEALASPSADKVQVSVSAAAGGVLRLTPGVLRAAEAGMATVGIDVPQRAAAKGDGGGGAGAAGEGGSPSGSSALSLG